MSVGEIMGYVAAAVSGLIVVMRLVDTYFAERRKGQQAGIAQMSAAQFAAFQPSAERYQRATYEQMIGEIHARVGEIHAVVMAEDRERKASERKKLEADLRELEAYRAKQRRME